MPRRLALLAGLTALSCLAAYAANKKIPGFPVLFLGMFLSLLIASSVGERRSYALHAASFVFLGLALFEAYAVLQRWQGLEGRNEIGVERDADLGWAPIRKSAKYADSVRARSGKVIYAVHYT